MVAPRIDETSSCEELLARLTATAYSVALRHGLKAPFIEVELALWRELRTVLHQQGEVVDSSDPAGRAAGLASRRAC
jgi:hypothetical protein